MSRLRARLHFWWQRRLCIVRHDYDPVSLTKSGAFTYVHMRCFHCEHEKASIL